jgi:membrane fusion protein (multidrug efflux system)
MRRTATPFPPIPTAKAPGETLVNETQTPPEHPGRAARPLRRLGAVAAVGAAAALAACGRSAAKPAASTAPVEVGIVRLEPTAVTLTRELPGRTSAFRVAEVRARVNGIVLKRFFTEGSDVKEGQKLFQIDPAPYQAALEGAKATLARAEASVANARLTAKRNEELVEDRVVSRQEFENTNAALKAAEADVAAARAAVQVAQINLGYTTVTSPVSGRIGRSAVTEGAYVQAGQATLLATVQQLDPVYVDVAQSTAELLKLRRDLEAGKLQSAGAGRAKVRLVTEDGREYAVDGTLQFADVTVDPSTGSVALRALFPNPRGELLPGMFVRARLAEGVNPQALLVPQVAVTRDQKGLPVALVVNAERKVERRQLVTDRAVGDAWLVTSGVQPGDQVIVEGLQKVRPGAVVNPVPAASPKQAAR